jgi:hypothetical protein
LPSAYIFGNYGTLAGACLQSSSTEEAVSTMNTIDIDSYRQRLGELRMEHRDLDDVINRLSHEPAVDQLQMRRLKKRKLQIKDNIARIESKLIPDLDA